MGGGCDPRDTLAGARYGRAALASAAERLGGRRLEVSAVAVEPLDVPAPSGVRTPRMVRALADRAAGGRAFMLAIPLARGGIDADVAVRARASRSASGIRAVSCRDSSKPPSRR